MTKELFHVGIDEPELIQRSILEAARATVSCLQRYEKFKAVREEKKEAIEEFASIVREIYTLDGRLNRLLPKIGVTKKKAPAKDSKGASKKLVHHKPKPKPSSSELDALEKELANIDKAISKLK